MTDEHLASILTPRGSRGCREELRRDRIVTSPRI